MKTLLYYLLFVLMISCSSSGDDMEIFDNDTSETEDMMDKPGGENNSVNFVSDAHTTTGTASLNDAKTTLIFADFKTDDGPKLNVYLSTDKNSTDFVDLGALKGISGNFEYAIPENTDLTKYKVVSIWCVDFSVSFGHAILN